MPALPRHPDGSVPAWRANLARATTCRLQAARTTDREAQRRLRAAAYDLERLGLAQKRDACIAAYDAGRAQRAAVAAELKAPLVA